MKQPVDRVLDELGMPKLVAALEGLGGADLTSLLLDVLRRRAARVRPNELLRRYATDRFVRAPTVPFPSLRRVEDALITASAGAFEMLALAPLPGRFAHFQLFGLVSAGRDAGGRAFESAAAVEHLRTHAHALASLGAKSITVSLTDFSGGSATGIKDAVRSALAPTGPVTCVDDDPRESGRGYYETFCFKVHASFGGDAFETSDGGSVDWTRRLVGSAKERCFISGLGVDRVALAIGAP